MYQLKITAARSRTIVFVVYNLSSPKKRIDMRPTLEDLPSDSYYRLFDVVQFTFMPARHYSEMDYDKTSLEIIMTKGLPTTLTFRMRAPEEISSVILLDDYYNP